MPNRITGMYSGLDTESLIKDLVKAKSSKVESLKKQKTKAEWKQEQWASLNTKLKNLFSKSVSTMRYRSDYTIKKTSVSNPNAVSVVTGTGSMESVQSLSIKQLASTGYLTGGKMTNAGGGKITADTTISEIAGSDITGSFSVKVGDNTTEVNITAETKISDLVSSLNSAGVNANFDATNQRLFIGAKASGADNDFVITANNAGGTTALQKLGIESQMDDATKTQYETNARLAKQANSITDLQDLLKDENKELLTYLDSVLPSDPTPTADEIWAAINDVKELGATATAALNNAKNAGPVKLAGQDAIIELNGATFTSSSNNIEVNGLTFTCLDIADNITVTTTEDTDGIYDKIKNFFKEYNAIINEMDKLVNTKTTKGYDALTDDEKDAMTDKEIEKWEDKVKESILYGDDTLKSAFNGMKEIMAAGVEINGKTYYLSNFGINTASYFEAADYEKSAYHIDGDSDDNLTSGKDDVLKSLIATDSETVINFFAELSNNLYKKMDELSASSDYSSFGTYYDDKKYKTDMSDIEKKIAEAEEKLAAYEDKWYSKFSAMEKALSKTDSSNQYLSNLFS